MQTTWNLGLLYKNHEDPQIEKDVKAIESAYSKFEKKYKGKNDYLKNETRLLAALTDYENMFAKLAMSKPISYFHFILDLNSEDTVARSKSTILMQRFAKNEKKMLFFELGLAKIPVPLQKKFLKSKKLAHYHYYLSRVFIRGLKSLPSYGMWVDGVDKIKSRIVVDWKGQKVPLAAAMNMIADLKEPKERRELHKICMESMNNVADFAESEINAIVTNKKINDELRGFKNPYDQTLMGYQNNEKSVLALVKAVTDNFKISHKFYSLKAKILKLPNLEYSDRNIGIETNVKPLPFNDALELVRKIFASVDPKYRDILDSYLEKGQIDVFPRKGKTGGAYCAGAENMPTFVLLNHLENMDSVMTLSHEMGHAIHTELSKTQSPMYQGYSTATAEVASTLFESFVFDAVFETLSPEEKIGALHNKINDDIQTIFRQIACFNFEVELHRTIREKGSMSKEEIGSLMNKHVGAYLGPIVKMNEIDGNFFVWWSHIRRFFYVYSYAFGQLISKALYSKYKEDKSYLQKIEKFLRAGGSDTPENIFKSVGIDVTKPDFWINGLKSIEADIKKLEKLTKNR
jgi:oligoendopeptidase F